jgi:hypothetical protein
VLKKQKDDHRSAHVLLASVGRAAGSKMRARAAAGAASGQKSRAAIYRAL